MSRTFRLEYDPDDAIDYVEVIDGREVRIEGRIDLDSYVRITPIESFGASISLHTPKVGWEGEALPCSVSHSTGWSGCDPKEAQDQVRFTIELLEFALQVAAHIEFVLRHRLEASCNERRDAMKARGL